MPSTNSLVSKLRTDFPDYRFVEGEDFHWAPEEQTIYFTPGDDAAALLHELAHAELNHATYARDVLLLAMERDAWHYAKRRLAGPYGVTIDEEAVQDSLDTYREWLHKRSLCPNCEATGIQARKELYRCLACESTWHVNEARACALRRRLLTN